jgi:hypothetical protein
MCRSTAVPIYPALRHMPRPRGAVGAGWSPEGGTGELQKGTIQRCRGEEAAYISSPLLHGSAESRRGQLLGVALQGPGGGRGYQRLMSRSCHFFGPFHRLLPCNRRYLTSPHSASQTASTLTEKPVSSTDVAISPRPNTPWATYAPPSSFNTVMVCLSGLTIQYSGIPASA